MQFDQNQQYEQCLLTSNNLMPNKKEHNMQSLR